MGSNLGPLVAATADVFKRGLGDPSFAGWFAVAVYLLGAALCVLAGRAERRVLARRGNAGPRPIQRAVFLSGSPLFWWIAATVLLLLGINRQLDLQTSVTDFVRSMAKSQNWYEGRQAFQRMFIVAIGLASLSGLIAASWSLRRAPICYHLALGGLFFLLSFVAIRAASFHNVDAMLSRRVLGLKWNWILELGGIGLIAASAMLCLRVSWSTQSLDALEDHEGVRKYRISGR